MKETQVHYYEYFARWIKDKTWTLFVSWNLCERHLHFLACTCTSFIKLWKTAQHHLHQKGQEWDFWPLHVLFSCFSTKTTWAQFSLMPSRYLISVKSLKMSVKERKSVNLPLAMVHGKFMCRNGSFSRFSFPSDSLFTTYQSVCASTIKIQVATAAVQVKSSGEN
jgi:hypothetical protein